jgi:GNAT superfamily N-acetyltransferase
MAPIGTSMVVATSAEQIEQARGLFREYAAELAVDLCFQSFEAELASLPGKYGPPSGRLWVDICDGTVRGCVALRKMEADACEMKRLFVRPHFRGLGLGRCMAEQVIVAARQMGYRRMVLDTLERLKPAVRLYESLGFVRIDPYCTNPLPDAVFMQRMLV